MKVIFSRKGFDSGYGKCPSPIFPDGTFVSLPIPSKNNPHRMGDLDFNGTNLGELATQLAPGNITVDTAVHLDPDLDPSLVSRKPGWRPSLGQLSAAQTHLQNNGVGAGDIFLFFGWFREVENKSGLWRYVREAPGRHVIFGWLQIGEILDIARERAAALSSYPWLTDHPHLSERDDYQSPSKHNTIYLSSDQCSIGNGLAGGGTFLRYRDDLCLTWPGRSRSQWRLPLWMMPNNGESSMTYHPAPRWSAEDGHTLLKSAAKGQEFVFDADRHPEARRWIETILMDSA